MLRKQRWYVTFALGMVMMWAFLSLKSTFYWRTVQVLRNPTSQHVAVLERVDSIDTNFRISVDGAVIYGSPDFSPQETIPLREVLTWDDTKNFLIFEVGGRRLFGYDLTRKQKLNDSTLLNAKVSTAFENYGYEGKLPSSK